MWAITLILIILFFIGPYIWLISLSTRVCDLEWQIKKLKKEGIKEAACKPEPEAKPEPETEYKLLEQVEKPFSIVREIPPAPTETPAPFTPLTEGKGEFEKVVLGRVFLVAGALAIIFAVAFFIQAFSLPPAAQVGIAALVGVLMVGLSLKLHKNEMKNYAEILMGTGFSVLFITVFCASSLFDVISIYTASAIALLLVITTFFAAQKYKTSSLVALGLVGGYICPIFLNRDVTTSFLFSHLVFLNIITVVFTYHNRDKTYLNIINLTLSTMTLLAILFSRPDGNVLYAVSLWLVYLVNDLILIHKEQERDILDIKNILLWASYLSLILLSATVFYNQPTTAVGLSSLGAGIVYILCASLIKIKTKTSAKPYIWGFLTAFLVATYCLNSDLLRVSLWSLEAVAVVYFAFRYRSEDLKRWANLFCYVALAGALLSKGTFNIIASYNGPLLNNSVLLLGLPALAMYINYKLLKNPLFKFLSITLVYTLVTVEYTRVMSLGYLPGSFADNIQAFGYIIIGYIYALQMKQIASNTELQMFRLSSQVAFVVTTAALVILGYPKYELQLSTLGIRAVAFLVGIYTSIALAKETKETIYKYTAVVLGLLLVNYSLSDYLLSLTYLSSSYIPMAVSVISTLYAGVVMLCGIYKNIEYLKLSGIWIVILMIVKMLCFDVQTLQKQEQVWVFLSLGVILMIVSYVYIKKIAKK